MQVMKQKKATKHVKKQTKKKPEKSYKYQLRAEIKITNNLSLNIFIV